MSDDLSTLTEDQVWQPDQLSQGDDLGPDSSFTNLAPAPVQDLPAPFDSDGRSFWQQTQAPAPTSQLFPAEEDAQKAIFSGDRGIEHPGGDLPLQGSHPSDASQDPNFWTYSAPPVSATPPSRVPPSVASLPAAPDPDTQQETHDHFNWLFNDPEAAQAFQQQPAAQAMARLSPEPLDPFYNAANAAYLSATFDPSARGMAGRLLQSAYTQANGLPPLQGKPLFDHIGQNIKAQADEARSADAQRVAYQSAREHTWSRMVEENTGTPIDFSPDHFNQWTTDNATAFKNKDPYATLHDYVNIVSAASDEAAPLAQKVRQVADLIKASTAGVSAIAPDSIDQAADIFSSIPAASRPLAFGMLRAYSRKHGIDSKNFLTMLAEVPARVATDAYSGLTLVPYEARLNRTIFELQHGVARLLKNGRPDLAMLRLTEDDAPPPGEPSDLGASRLLAQWQTRPVTDAERDILIAQARQELERVGVVHQLRGFLKHEYDPVKPTMEGVGGLFQNVAYFGAMAGSYAAIGAIPEAGPVAAGMAFVGTSIDDIRTQYPEIKPEDAIAIGTSIAIAQMLILGGMGRVVAGDARGATLWLRGLEASKPALTQAALRLAAESTAKGVKLTGLMAASTAVPLAVKLLGEEAGMKIPGFDALEEWRTLAHPQPETLGILALLWLTGAGLAATRYAQVAKLAKDYGFATEDANRFAAARNLSERFDAFEQGMANMSPEARQALAQAADNGVFKMKQAKTESKNPSEQSQPEISLKERVEKDLDGAAREFLEKYARETPDGPSVISPDRAREMDPAYRRDPIGQNNAVHKPAVLIANRAFEIALETAPPGDVVFLAGAPGAGKTRSLTLVPNAAIVVDRTLANYEDAAAQIQDSLDAGRKVRVNYIYRPLGETVIGTLKRALQDKAAGGGRPVPVTAVASAYEKSWLNVIKLQEHFGDKINFLLIDMTGNAFRTMEPKEVISIPNRSISSLEIEARAIALKWISENTNTKGVTSTFREAALERRKK